MKRHSWNYGSTCLDCGLRRERPGGVTTYFRDESKGYLSAAGDCVPDGVRRCPDCGTPLAGTERCDVCADREHLEILDECEAF